MCVTCGCGGKSATYEDIDKHSKKTSAEKSVKKSQHTHVHHDKETKKKA